MTATCKIYGVFGEIGILIEQWLFRKIIPVFI